ncbi:MAG TPA: type IX secretion system sortase PorU, partial [Cytophagales bacterium]|nr:type IX secretion system sortase PorU [Cytophagales bacterium]
AWKSPVLSTSRDGVQQKVLDFESSGLADAKLLVGNFVVRVDGDVNNVTFSKVEYTQCTPAEDSILDANLFDTQIKYEITRSTARKQTISFVSIVPIVKGADQRLYKIKSFHIQVTKVQQVVAPSLLRTSNVASNAVFAAGDWYKVATEKAGIYKLDYGYFKNLGIAVEQINPKTLQMYGFGGMLPEKNADNRYYDIPEIPLYFSGNDDERFDANEYVLVYLQGPNSIVYTNAFDIKKNIYTDKAYFFITHSQATGKRIASKAQLDTYDAEYDYYDYIYEHEIDQTNYIHSGRDWTGESLVENPNLSFSISLPTLVPTTDVYVKGRVYGSNTELSTCKVNFNGTESSYALLSRQNGLDFNRIMVRSFDFSKIHNADDLTGTYNLSFKYNFTNSSNKTNLDYFQVAAKAQLIFNGSELSFRNEDAIGNISSKYIVKTSKPNIQVWDVSQIDRVSSLPLAAAQDGFSFIDSSSTYNEYIAVDMAAQFPVPAFVEKVANQNIHGEGVPDLLIVAYPGFISAAEKLANFRRSHDGYTVQVVSLDKLYNEFSSGAQDITAIRNYAKYLYDRDPQKFKWLLLFGACSYDYKNRIKDNTNYVPIYETYGSEDLILSYQSDDYYGLLDNQEGNTLIGAGLDIAIGRLPVRSMEEANGVVDKLIHYSSDKATYDKWRSSLTFVCDDGDGNLHMDSTEDIVAEVMKYSNAIKINKLYLPLFPEVSTPIGQESPNLNQKLIDEINKGTLIINYSGHGREAGWAGENIITSDVIKNLKNYNKLFLMITATCEFGRYDDPNNFSSIQQAILNPYGGAVATIGATRPVFASSNKKVNTSMMKYLYEKVDGKYNTVGDVMMKSKLDGTAILLDENVKNYGLLSDPSLTLNYPKYEISIDSITDENKLHTDTLRALSKVTISGAVRNQTEIVSSFNGEVTLSLFDKEFDKMSKYDPSSDYNYQPEDIIRPYKIRESIIYQGKAQVKDGKFSISFMVPKDISYLVGNGLILTYAKNDSSDLDAAGGYTNFTVGDAK